MKIEITKINGSCQSFNGDITYHDSYVVIQYKPTVIPITQWVELVIPWRIINEIEVRL